MVTIFPGKRRWQRLVDTPAGSSEERRRDVEDDDGGCENVTDETLLLSAEKSPISSSYVDVSEPSHDHEYELKLLNCDKSPWFPVNNWDTFHASSRQEEVSFVASPSLAFGKSFSSSSNGASWRGLKLLVKKQFMPPFPFGKDSPDEMSHLRQKRMQEAMNKEPKVLGEASGNSVELRKLDAKIQNGINKSVIRMSTKKAKSKENLGVMAAQHDLSLAKALRSSSQSKAAVMAAQHDLSLAKALRSSSQSKAACPEWITKGESHVGDCVVKANPLKENTITRKLKKRTKKWNASPPLLPTSMD